MPGPTIVTRPSAERWPVEHCLTNAEKETRLHLLSKRIGDTEQCSIDNALFTGDSVRVWWIGGKDRDDEIGITSTHVEYAIAVMDRLEVGRLVAALSLWLVQSRDADGYP